MDMKNGWMYNMGGKIMKFIVIRQGITSLVGTLKYYSFENSI